MEHITHPGFKQCPGDRRHPAHFTTRAVRLVNAEDSDAALVPGTTDICHGGAEKNLVGAVMQAGIGKLGNLHALRQETDASVDLAQAFLAIDVVAVFRAIPVAGRPMHDLDHLGPLPIDQFHQLRTQARVAICGDVVFAAQWHRRQLHVVVIVVVVRLPGECLAHAARQCTYAVWIFNAMPDPGGCRCCAVTRRHSHKPR